MGNKQCGLRHYRSNTDNIFGICKILEKKWECIEAVHQLYIQTSRKIMIQLGGRSCIIFSLSFFIPLKLVILLKMCLNETYSRVQVGKHLSDRFPIKNSLKKRTNFNATAFQICFRVYHYEGSGEPGWLEIKWYTSTFGLC